MSPSERQVAHVLLTRPPLFREQAPFTVRLACVRRAASVRPEPGSNSLKFVLKRPSGRFNLVQINANVNLINAICVYPEFSLFSTSDFSEESTR